MIPKINACLDAVNNGVTAVGIIDGRKKHSILFEIFFSCMFIGLDNNFRV